MHACVCVCVCVCACVQWEKSNEHHIANLFQKYDDVMKEMHKDKAANYMSEDSVSVERLAELRQKVLATREKVPFFLFFSSTDSFTLFHLLSSNKK